jgi:hypothetical protein
MRQHLADIGPRAVLREEITMVAWGLGAIIALFALVFGMRVLVNLVAAMWRRVGYRQLDVLLIVVPSLVAVLLFVLRRRLSPARFSVLLGQMGWWSAEIGILSALLVVVWLHVKEPIEGLVQYWEIGVLVGALLAAAVGAWLLSTLAVYYLPGWVLIGLAVALTMIVGWSALAYVPFFLIVLAFATTLFTVPWLSEWWSVAGMVLWLLLLVSALSRDQQSDRLKPWMGLGEPLMWLGLVWLTARQWALL